MSDHPGMLNVTEAAARLGISPEAVRKRALRGTLPGEKIDGSWYIRASSLPPVAVAGRPDDVPDEASGRHPDGTRTAGQATAEPAGRPDATPRQPPVDLQPLADMIERLHAENVRLTEAATVWQVRAVRAETQLAQLTAGDITSDGGSEAETAVPEPPRAPEPGNKGQEPGSANSAASAGVLARLARWLRGNG